MATHDYVIANQTGANTRSDLNNLFSAIVSQNSSGSEPATKYAYMIWADTGNNLLKIRNSANNAWISVYSLTTGANAGSLPLAGGQMTGNITFSGTQTVDGVDISVRDAVLTSTTTLATNALPKAGGTMTGNIDLGDNVQARFGGSQDLLIYHDGSNSYIKEQGTGNLDITSNGGNVSIMGKAGENSIIATADGSVDLYHNNAKKIETTANGVTVTGGAVGTMTTDNDGSFSMSASNNFKCTPTGNFTLTFTNIVAQSGNILLVNSGGHTVSAHANTKVDANLLATVSTAGTYLLSYFSDGTNVYMTNSAIYT